jgi:hypothetical protein
MDFFMAGRSHLDALILMNKINITVDRKRFPFNIWVNIYQKKGWHQKLENSEGIKFHIDRNIPRIISFSGASEKNATRNGRRKLLSRRQRSE